MTKHRYMILALLGLTLPSVVSAAPVVFDVGGSDSPFSIQPTVDVFRSALGGSNNGNAPGPLPGGRREINWDGGGSALNTPVGTPFNGFQDTRGGQLVTPGSGFVQAPASASGADDDLGTFFGNPTYDGTFGAFSPQRLFVPIGSNTLDCLFYLPGSGGATPATVQGFGAVFTDVDLANSTRLEYFDHEGNLLYGDFVSQGTVDHRSLSFLGVIFSGGEQISRVRITSGTHALSNFANDDPLHGVDLVAMDDFLYGEPVARVVPEPGTWALFGAGLILLMATAVVRHRRSGSHAQRTVAEAN